MKFLTLLVLINAILAADILAQGRISREEVLHDIKVLSNDSLEGRRTATPGAIAAARYITSRFQESGLKMAGQSYQYPFRFKAAASEISGVNIVGIIPGTIEDAIVITAHYDHEGIKNGEVYNGADDNASGVGAVLALAKYFSQNPIKHKLVFVAFDAEEMGLQGAKAFVENPPAATKSIKLNINFDMVSHNDKNEIYAVGTYHYPQFKPTLMEVGAHSGINLLFGHDNPDLGLNDWTFSSDHGPFHQAEIPFIYFGVDDHKDYHKPTDDFATINPDFYINVIEMLIDAVIALDKHLAE